jgi:sugar (pentulose or hexulose) kinase
VAVRKYVLAVDAGSSNCRALVFDVGGNLVSSAHREWTYDAPAEVAPLGREFDPVVFWDTICQVSRESIGKAGVERSDIVAVSAASQRQGVVFLDKDGAELYGGPNTDLRALMEGFAIDAERGTELRCITGHSPAFLFAPAKLRWFRLNRPAVYDRIATMLTISNWILYRLSGRRVAEPSGDSETGLVDISGSCWSADLQKAFGLAEGICPEMAAAGACMGSVTAEAAEQTGLVAGTPVVVGGADTQCGLLGMGVVDEGHVGIVAGWSAAIQMVTDNPVTDTAGKIWSSCHILPGKWVIEANAAEAGGVYAWLGGLLFGGAASKEEAYMLMDRMAGEAPAGSGGAVAFIGPRAMDMTRLKPLLGGVLFPITPSVTAVEKKHLVRAALENLSFAFKANCLQLEETLHLKMRSVSLGGGLARSETLGQVLADVLATPIHCYGLAEVTSCGVAMCAAVGAGVYSDLIKAGEAMCPGRRVIIPNEHGVEEYARYYERWLRTARWLDTLGEETM